MSSALLVIDMLEEFLHGEPAQLLIPHGGAEPLVRRIARLLERTRRAGVPIIYVSCAHEADDLIFKAIPAHALRGTPGARVVEALAPSSGDLQVEKQTYDGFYQTPLETILLDLGIEQLFLAGIQTDCCVHATGQGAIFRGFRASLIEDCCETINAARQQVGLERFRALIGPTLPSEQLDLRS